MQFSSKLLIAACGPLVLAPMCFPQAGGVESIEVGGRKATEIRVDLQGAPNSMEPIAEPRRIRVDDRARVRFVLDGLSPLDVCTRNTGTPTVETPVPQSLVTTIAGLGRSPFL